MVLTTTYTITDIGKLLGTTFSEAFAVNAGGEVVGTWEKAGSGALRAFLFADKKATDLGTFGAFGALAMGINDANRAVLMLDTSSVTNPEATALYKAGTLSMVNGITVGTGHLEINDSNAVLGYSNTTNDATLSVGGTLIDLGSLAGHGSVGMGISNHGLVVGYSNTGRTVSTTGNAPFGPAASAPLAVAHAFLYQNHQMAGLPTLGGDDAIATAVNGIGVVVGYSQTKGDTATHVFSYANGKLHDLGAPKGSDDAWATAINASNVVVGDFRVSPTSTTQHAFIYVDGIMTDLNSLIPKNSGYTLIDATSISNNGQIVVNAINNKSGEEQALILSPVAAAPKALPQPKPRHHHHRRHHR
jgi:probable HAF family extracellular repeat protein